MCYNVHASAVRPAEIIPGISSVWADHQHNMETRAGAKVNYAYIVGLSEVWKISRIDNTHAMPQHRIKIWSSQESDMPTFHFIVSSLYLVRDNVLHESSDHCVCVSTSTTVASLVLSAT